MSRPTMGKYVAFLLAAITFAACGGLGKMNKDFGDVTYTIDPNPLIVRGDSVEVNVNGNFPPKYFHKKAIVEATPMLKYSAGETPYKTAYYQGESAAGNYTVIPYESGKAFTYTNKIAYRPEMETSELYLNILGRKGKQEKAFDPVKFADGVITTPYLMLSDDKVLVGKDRFERITAHKEQAVINYLVNSSNVRSGELSDKDIKAMSAFMKKAVKDQKLEMKGLTIEAYASPEGELTLNENLADDRAKSAKGWAKGVLKTNKYTRAADDTFYNLVPKGEDWDGFKTAMQASSIADKELILRILEMYSDLAKREQEIKNLAKTYLEVADKILPKLRRSSMDLNYERVGKSDEELRSMSSSRPDSLNVEEILYSATLTEDLNAKLKIYQDAERMYPNDHRTSNNVGFILMQQNRMADAKAKFQKANGVQENAVSNNNLGVIARLEGDRKKAAEFFKKAAEAGPEVKYNMGLLDIQNGDYSSANSNMSGMKTFNAALAKTLGGDASGAQTILEGAPEKDTAMGHYLHAIISARAGNGEAVRSHLGQAVAKDASLRDKAMKDLEFAKFKDNLGL